MRRAPILLTFLIALLASAWLYWNRRAASAAPRFEGPAASAGAEGSRRGLDLEAAPHGERRVGVSAPSAPVANDPKEPARVDKAGVVRDLHWFGRVLAREDRRPVSGARITAEPGHAALESGADGRFELWLDSRNAGAIEVDAPGYGRVFVQAAKGHDDPEAAMVVLLSRSAKLRARLLLAGGAPAAGGSVQLETESYHLGVADHGDLFLPLTSAISWRATADASGLCSVDDLPSDVPLRITILVDQAIAKEDLPALSLHPGETREVEWSIGGGCDVEGTVVDEGAKPVEGCTIWLLRAEDQAERFFLGSDHKFVVQASRTDSEGRFTLHDVSAGRWWVGPASTRDEFEPPKPDAIAGSGSAVVIPEGSPTQHVDLRVSRGLYIHGTVLDPDGKPFPGTYVWSSCDLAFFDSTSRTGEDGTFAVGPLIPGRYEVYAQGDTHADSDRVSAEAGEQGVVLRLRRAGILLGSVVDAQTGKPCRGELTVAIRSAEGRPAGSLMMMQTDDDGTFRVEGLVPGIYDLGARAGSKQVGILKSVTVHAGEETGNQVITVAPGATLRIRYAGKEGYAQFSVYSDGVCLRGDGIPAGGVAETDSLPGHVVVEYYLPGATDEKPQKKELDLQVGEEREVVLGGDH